MLTVHDRIAFLQGSLFADLDEDTLADIANLLTEVDIASGEVVFRKGETGTAMFIIVRGRIRIFDGDQPIDDLREREVFGEMAVLDPAPRVASAMAVIDSHLLCLDQGPLFALMGARFEVVRAIIKVLCGRLRARVADVSELKLQVRELSDPRSGGPS